MQLQQLLVKGCLFLMFISGLAHADVLVSEPETIFGFDKTTAITALKVIAFVCFVLSAIFSFAPVRALLHKLFIRFEIHINQVIALFLKLLNFSLLRKLAKGIEFIGNKLIALLRTLRLTSLNIYLTLIAILLTVFIVRPEQVSVFALSYLTPDAFELINACAFGGLAYIIGYIITNKIELYNLPETNNEKDITCVRLLNALAVFLAFPLLALAIYSLQRHTDQVAIIAFSSIWFIYFCFITHSQNYFFTYKKGITEILFSLIQIPVFVGVAYILLQPGNAIFANDKQFASFLLIFSFSMIFLLFQFQNTLEIIEELIQQNKANNNNQEIKVFPLYETGILTYMFSISGVVLGAIFYAGHKHVTIYVIAAFWVIVSIFLLIKLVPELFTALSRIFSGRFTWIISLLAGVMSLNITTINNLKAQYGMTNLGVWFNALSFIVFVITAILFIKKQDEIYFKKAINKVENRGRRLNKHLGFVFSVLGVAISTINLSTQSYFFVITNVICTISALLYLAQLLSFNFVKLLKIFKYYGTLTKAFLLIIFAIHAFNALPSSLSYLPHIAVFLFITAPSNWKEWAETFYERDKLNPLFLGTLFIPAIPFTLNTLPSNSVIGLSMLVISVISLAIALIITLVNIHKAFGYFVAGISLYYVATFFEDGTLLKIYENIKGFL